MAIWLDLAAFYTPLGLIGTVLAVASAIIAAAAAVIVGAPSSGGIATAGWLMAVILSFCSAFTGDWVLPAVAIGAMPAALILAASVALVRVTLFRRVAFAR